MICLFLFIGRFGLLTDLGSKTKNLLSVSSITFVGILIIFLIYPNKDGMNPLVLYWAYIAPLIPILHNLNMDYIFKKNETVSYCIFSIVPSLLMWIGLEWKVKKMLKVK
jgi:hypothetical protein